MTLSASTSPILDYTPAPPPRASRVGRFSASPWLLLPIILVVAGALRWFQLDHESLWLDEFLAAQNSTGRGHLHMTFPRDVVIDPPPHLTRLSDGPGLAAIWASLHMDSHPPLYFMVLNLWRQGFGESDLAMRALSVFFSLASILVMFDVVRLLHGKTVALWASALMAVAGAQICLAQEARNYTMMLALVLGACDAVVRMELLGASQRRAIALGACMLTAMLTHYLAICAVAAIVMYALIRLRGRELRAVGVTVALMAAIFAVFWGPFLWEQTGSFSRELSAATQKPNEWTSISELRRLALQPLRAFTDPLKNSIMIGHVSAVLYVLPLLLLRRRRDLLLWYLLMLFAIVPVFLSDFVRSAHALAYARYTFIATAAVYALGAGMLSHMPGFLRHVVPLVLVIACILAIAEPYSPTKADSRELAQYLAERCGQADILIVHTLPDHDWQARAMYLGLSHYGPPPCPVIFMSDPPDSELARHIRAADEVWAMSPTLAFPRDEIFPGSVPSEQKLFPWVGTVEKLQLP